MSPKEYLELKQSEYKQGEKTCLSVTFAKIPTNASDEEMKKTLKQLHINFKRSFGLQCLIAFEIGRILTLCNIGTRSSDNKNLQATYGFSDSTARACARLYNRAQKYPRFLQVNHSIGYLKSNSGTAVFDYLDKLPDSHPDKQWWQREEL
jgi:hypothetical protein